jgi:four helix bundle protein
MDLGRAIYRATEMMPRREIFGLTSQMRRAATSVPLNISEGFGRRTPAEFLHGLRVSMGSLCELMTAYELATSLNMIKPERTALDMLAEEDRDLGALILSLERKKGAKHKDNH